MTDQQQHPAESKQHNEDAAEKELRSPWLRVVLIVAIAVTMCGLFGLSYSLALGRPTPKHVPTAIVHLTDGQPTAANQLQASTNGALELRPYPTEAAARAAISGQQVYAGIIEAPSGPQLLVSSATGASLSRVLQQAAQPLVTDPSVQLKIVDVHPLPKNDPQGLVSFYLTLAATIVGFITMFQLRANVKELTLPQWFGAVALLAVVAGFVLAVIGDPVLGALRGRFFEVWLAFSVQSAIVALSASTLLVLVGRWAILPNWTIFILLGNTSSGGPVAPPLLPRLFSDLGHLLPTAATVTVIHDAAYFPGLVPWSAIAVNLCWLIGAAAALLLFARARHRTPAS